MSEPDHSRRKILWLLPPIIIGIVAFVVLKGGKQEPMLASNAESARSVRIMTIEPVDFVPIARGYGTVEPARVWKAVAQVSGRITSLHPRLSDGAIIELGETLVTIDPVDYQLALAQAETALKELDIQQANTEQSLAIEERNLALAEKEVARQKRLVKQGSVSQSSVDSAERTMLSSRTLVQNLRNTLALLPSQKNLQQSKIIQAQRDLDNTQIIAPMNVRITSLEIETDQYVSKGQHLFSGDSADQVEIIAQVSLSSLKNLFAGQPDMQIDMSEITRHLGDLTGFIPTVSMDIGNTKPARWKARFVRFDDRVDSQTRTMGLVVAIDNPLQQVIPGQRPPLSKGMLVEVQIAGRTQSQRLVIPRSTIRNGNVYLLDGDNRLKITPVHKLFDQQDLAVVDDGIKPGDRLVLTDLVPAVDGMLLKPVDVSIDTLSDISGQ
jgi:RND family efflux transporter MFP subunit